MGKRMGHGTASRKRWRRVPSDAHHSITFFKPMSVRGPPSRVERRIMVISCVAFGSGAGFQECSDNRQTDGRRESGSAYVEGRGLSS